MSDGPGDDEWSDIGRSSAFPPGAVLAVLTLVSAVLWFLVIAAMLVAPLMFE